MGGRAGTGQDPAENKITPLEPQNPSLYKFQVSCPQERVSSGKRQGKRKREMSAHSVAHVSNRRRNNVRSRKGCVVNDQTAKATNKRVPRHPKELRA